MSLATETRYVIPAPADSDVAWYEAVISPGDQKVRLVGYAEGHREVARHETHVGDAGELTTVVSEGDSRAKLELRGPAEDSGQIQFRGRVNGRDFTIGGTAGDTDSAQPSSLELSDEEEYLLRRWRGLTGSLQTLATATGEPAADSPPGCNPCMLLGATIVQAAEHCVHGEKGACSALLSEWTIWEHHCVPPPCS